MPDTPPDPAAPAALLPRVAAFGCGALLTLMVMTNAEVGRHWGALWSSLAPHLTGTLVAVAAVLATRAAWLGRGLPLWAYLGGLSGALTVIFTSTAANTALALSGTMALGLVGQAAFARAADRWGWLGLPRRRADGRDTASLLLVLAGSALILWGAA